MTNNPKPTKTAAVKLVERPPGVEEREDSVVCSTKTFIGGLEVAVGGEEMVFEGDAPVESVPVGDGVGEAEAVVEGEAKSESVGEGEGVGEELWGMPGVRVREGVIEGEAPGLRVEVGVGVGVGVDEALEESEGREVKDSSGDLECCLVGREEGLDRDVRVYISTVVVEVGVGYVLVPSVKVVSEVLVVEEEEEANDVREAVVERLRVDVEEGVAESEKVGDVVDEKQSEGLAVPKPREVVEEGVLEGTLDSMGE